MKSLILPGCLSPVGNDLQLTQDELGEQLSYNNSFRMCHFKKKKNNLASFTLRENLEEGSQGSVFSGHCVGADSCSPASHYSFVSIFVMGAIS